VLGARVARGLDHTVEELGVRVIESFHRLPSGLGGANHSSLRNRGPNGRPQRKIGRAGAASPAGSI
jgi:hypothetical protein